MSTAAASADASPRRVARPAAAALETEGCVMIKKSGANCGGGGKPPPRNNNACVQRLKCMLGALRLPARDRASAACACPCREGRCPAVAAQGRPQSHRRIPPRRYRRWRHRRPSTAACPLRHGASRPACPAAVPAARCRCFLLHGPRCGAQTAEPAAQPASAPAASPSRPHTPPAGSWWAEAWQRPRSHRRHLQHSCLRLR